MADRGGEKAESAGVAGAGGGGKRARPDHDLDEDGELIHPPRATLREEPHWISHLSSIPRNCSAVVGGRPPLSRMPLRLPPNRISLRDTFVTRENYQRLGLGGIKHYYSLPPDAPAIAKRYKWRKCAARPSKRALYSSTFAPLRYTLSELSD